MEKIKKIKGNRSFQNHLANSKIIFFQKENCTNQTEEKEKII